MLKLESIVLFMAGIYDDAGNADPILLLISLLFSLQDILMLRVSSVILLVVNNTE